MTPDERRVRETGRIIISILKAPVTDEVKKLALIVFRAVATSDSQDYVILEDLPGKAPSA